MSDQESTTNVIVLTRQYRIIGKIALVPGARITDYMQGSHQFIAVTEAQVQTYDGQPVLTSPFLNINRDHIEIVVPTEMVSLD